MSRFSYHQGEYDCIQKELRGVEEALEEALRAARRGLAALDGQSGYGVDALQNRMRNTISLLSSRIREANNALLFWNELHQAIMAAEADALVISRGLPYSGVSLMNTDKSILEYIETRKKTAGLIGEIDDIIKVFSHDKSKMLDNLKNKIFPKSLSKALGYFKDGAKLVKSLIKGDKAAIGDLAVKYAQKALKWGMGLEGFAGTALPVFIWNVAENAYTGLEYTGKPTVMGFAKYLWGVSGGALLETGAEVGYDITKKVPVLNIDDQYYELTGKRGVEGFYEGLRMLGREMFGDYYDDGVFEGVARGVKEIGSYVYQGFESSIMKLFK